MKINEVAKLSGVTVRTLHYYDEIGLLKPSAITEVGYRVYEEEELAALQQILFFRELGFTLNQIKEIMSSPAFNQREALENHRVLLIKNRERLDQLINLVDHTLKGEGKMKFEAFDMTEVEDIKTKYAEEVKARWGNSPQYDESSKKTSGYDKEQWEKINEECNTIFKLFQKNRDSGADSTVVQELVEVWKDFITKRFYKCTNEILQGLGLMYVGDERFKENIDKQGDGLAEFISEAITIYCNKA